jgi:hypothetical protein
MSVYQTYCQPNVCQPNDLKKLGQHKKGLVQMSVDQIIGSEPSNQTMCRPNDKAKSLSAKHCVDQMYVDQIVFDQKAWKPNLPDI